nr:MAG TPA: hypothetical protein [Caudoviricetes sp.]
MLITGYFNIYFPYSMPRGAKTSSEPMLRSLCEFFVS